MSAEYIRYFHAKEQFDPADEKRAPPRYSYSEAPDNRDAYLVSEEVERAVNVALATGRPLLVKGEPGSGKTALARYVARYFGWGFEAVTVKSDTSVQDLQWRFDSVRRLNDAFRGGLRSRAVAGQKSSAPEETESALEELRAYVEHGPLWRAFRLESQTLASTERGSSASATRGTGSEVLAAARPERVVLLIDEIDKADPDVPNGLLDALGNMRFRVSETGEWISAAYLPLVILTSNDERELPAAFLRRCVSVTLPPPDGDSLQAITRAHFAGLDREWLDDLIKKIFPVFTAFRDEAKAAGLRRPSTAEFLDAVQACHKLKVDSSNDLWQPILRLTLWKYSDPEALA